MSPGGGFTPAYPRASELTLLLKIYCVNILDNEKIAVTTVTTVTTSAQSMSFPYGVNTRCNNLTALGRTLSPFMRADWIKHMITQTVCPGLGRPRSIQLTCHLRLKVHLL